MALAHLPPDPLDAEKQEYAKWLDAAIGQLRAGEIGDTYDNLSAILTSKAYVDLTASQSEGGYPSPAAFMAMAPDLRKKRLSTLMRSSDKLEEGMVLFIDNLAESEPDRALALIGDLSRGSISGDLKTRLAEAAVLAQKAQMEAVHVHGQHHDFDLLKHAKSPPLAPGHPAPGEGPHHPDHDPRNRPEDAIKGEAL